MHKFHENLRHHYGDIYRLRNASSPRHFKFYVGLNKFLDFFCVFKIKSREKTTRFFLQDLFSGGVQQFGKYEYHMKVLF
jgi:hypothetical protein